MASTAPKLNRQWFDEKMQRRGLSLRALAKEVGIDAAALSKTLNGVRKMQVGEVRKIANALGEEEGLVLAHSISEGAAVLRSETTAQRRHPLFGCLQGMLTIPPDLDLTQPADLELADYLDEKYRKEWTGDQ